MRILSRHFLKGYLGFFFLTLVVGLILMTVVEMLVNFDDVVEHQEAAGGALPYLLLRVPSLYLREVVPFSSFLAAFLCLGLAARDSEITAAKSGGLAPLRLALPLLTGAAALALGALLLNETVLLNTTREFTRLENPDEAIVFRKGSFWYHRGRTFYNVQETDREARLLRGVQIFELDARGRLVENVEAEEVHVADARHWELRNATRRRFEPGTPTPPSTERASGETLAVAGERDLALLDASQETLSLPQLLAAIEARRLAGRDATRYRSRLHARLAEPASVWVLALLGVPVGLAVERTRSLARSALHGIAWVAGFRAAWHVATLLAETGVAISAAGMWGVLALFSAAGAALLTRVPR